MTRRIIRSSGGFSLIELLLYSGIFAVVGSLMTGVLFTVTKVGQQTPSAIEVSNQINFVMQTVNRLIKESSAVMVNTDGNKDTDASPLGQPYQYLVLRMKDSGSNPATDRDPIVISRDTTSVPIKIKMQEGVGANQKVTYLTTDRAVADKFEFRKFTNYPGHDTITIDLQLSYNTQNPAEKAERYVQGAVSRVSAATFDSSLIPGTVAPPYDIGLPGTRWGNLNIQSADVSGSVKTAGLQLTTGANNNYVLTSDALGNAAWAPAPASTGGTLTSISAADGSIALTPDPIINTGTIKLNLANPNNWTGAQTFSNNPATFNAGANFPGTGVWNSSGNVGIGTPSPGAKLHIKDGSVTIENSLASNSAILTIQGVGVGVNSVAHVVLKDATNNQYWYLENRQGDLNKFYLESYDGTTWRQPFKIAKDAPSNTLYLDSTGNVGIGTTAFPTGSRLHVNGGNIAVQGQAVLDADATNIKVGDLIGGDGNRGLVLRAGNADQITITTGGDVGIGTASIQEKLQVSGDLKVVSDSDVTSILGSGAIYTQNIAGTGGLHIDVNEIQTFGDALYLQNDNGWPTHINNTVHVTTSGGVGIGTTPITSEVLAVAVSPTLGARIGSIGNDGTVSLFVTPAAANRTGLVVRGLTGQSADILRAETASGANDFVVNSSGNVGIGGAPSAVNKLDVTGTIEADGLKLTGTTGAGYVLTDVNGTGNAAWKAAAATGVLGSGTADYLPIWLTGGASLGTSVITQSGSNVGIGTAVPDEKLTVTGGNIHISDANIGPGRNFIINNGGKYFQLGLTSGWVSYWANNASWDGTNWNYVNTGGYGGQTTLLTNNNGVFNFQTANNATNPVSWNSRLYIANAGNVGIGTISPSEKLQVAGNVRLGQAPATLTTLSVAMLSTDTTATVVSTTGYPSAGILLIDSEAIAYTGTGATTFTGLTRGVLGTTAAAHSLGAAVNNYIFTGLTTATTPKMVVTGSGNVGIGNTAPASKLDVTGDVRWSGALQTGSVPWARLTTFPTACTSGFVTGVGGTLTCVSEADPQVGTLNANDVPRWNGSALTTGIITDNGTAVGIGTAPTSAGLTVNGTILTTGSGAGINLFDRVAYGNSYLITSPQASVLKITDSAQGLDRITINSSGNVGIGTSNPLGRLHIDGGDIQLANTALQTPFRISSYNNSDSLWLISQSATKGEVHISSNNTLNYDNSIALQYTPGIIGGQAGQLKIGQLSKNNLSYTHGITSLYTNGVERLRINSTGQVQISALTSCDTIDADLSGNLQCGTDATGITGTISLNAVPKWNGTALSNSSIVETGGNVNVGGAITATGAITGSNLSGANTGDQTITLTGDVTGSGTGSFPTTLVNSGVIAGTYRSVTVDAKGRATGGTNPTTFAGYGISDTSANLAAAITNETGSGALVFGTSPTFTTSITVPNSGLLVQDTAGGQTLQIKPGSDLTLNRILTINTGDASRTITLSGDTTLSGINTGDQTITLTGDVIGSGTGSFAATIAAQTSAAWAGKVSDETGSGAWVFANSPTFSGNVTMPGTGIWNSLGEVGIGTLTPGAKLEVAGQIKITGGIPGQNKVLTSDASGLADWQAIPNQLPSGSANQTLRFDGVTWSPSNFLINTEAGIGIGVTPSIGAKLEVAGQIKITGGTPGAGKVLTSNAAGLADWQTPTGGLGGSGGLNSIAKFTTPNGTTLGNSLLVDDGTNVGVGTGAAVPGEKLDVQGNARLRKTGTATAVTQYPSYDLKLQASAWDTTTAAESVNNFTLRNTGLSAAGGDYRFGLINNTGTEVLSVKANGNVGIGTTNPTAKLQVMGGNIATLGSFGIGTINPLQPVHIIKSGSSDPAILFENFGASFYTMGIDVSDLSKPFIINPGVTLGAPNPPAFYLNTFGLGLGVNSQTNRLDVKGGVAIGTNYAATWTAPSNGALIEGDVGINTQYSGNWYGSVPQARLHSVVNGLDTRPAILAEGNEDILMVYATPYIPGTSVPILAVRDNNAVAINTIPSTNYALNINGAGFPYGLNVTGNANISGTIRGATFGFGGMYTKDKALTPNCVNTNPLVSPAGCSCPTGFTATIIASPCLTSTCTSNGKGEIYMCWK